MVGASGPEPERASGQKRTSQEGRMSRFPGPLVQFAEYFLGGMGYFWSGYATFAVCYSGLHWSWLPAKILADIVGWTLNYAVQRYWAFASPALERQEIATASRYGMLTLANLALD